MADVCVIGLGYIGLPSAALIARAGHQVLGIDVNPAVVETINAGGIHIEEADLEGLVNAMVTRGKLKAALAPEPSDVFMIAVPTPFADDHAPDISYVLAAARAIAPVLKRGDIVILESTSPVGTTEKVRDLLSELRPDLRMPYEDQDGAHIAIAYCPERVLPGRILIELIANDRSIGGITMDCARVALDFYKRFVAGTCIVTSARAAEMVKLTENAFRDVNIAFANELSILCDGLRLDPYEVIRLANRHPRVNILQPGPGVGGHCIAVDPWFIVHADRANSPLIRTAREVNDGKVAYTIDRATALIEGHPAARVALFGLAFKPNIDDLRESPAIEVAHAIAKAFGERVDIVEPHVAGLPDIFAGTRARFATLAAALAECDLIVLLVDHDQFKAIPPELLDTKQVYDTRGVWGGPLPAAARNLPFGDRRASPRPVKLAGSWR